MTTSKGPSFKELNIIRDNYKQIASSLTSNEGCRRIVLDELYSQKIISEEQHISISNKERFQGAQHSTNDLLHEVIQFVKISPNRFIEVLEIMEKEAVLRNTVKSMKFQLNTVPHIMNGKRPPVIAPKPTRAKSVGVLPKVVPLHSRPRTQSTKVPYIHEQSDVTAKAQLLKSQFTALIVSIKNSPESDEIHIADLKRHIQVFLGCTFDNVSAGLQKHINCIEQIESIPEILDYLQQNNFLGYFNSCLLEEVASLLEDRFVSQEIEKYKDMRTTFLMEATFSRILQLFEEHPDLVPTVAVEFPTVVFEVNTLSWSDKAIFSCTIYFDNCFSWIRASALKVDKQERLRLVYAVPPRVYNAAASSLKKVSVLQELTTMQITVTDVPDITFCESVSYIIIMSTQLHTCTIHRMNPCLHQIHKLC